MGKVNIDIDWCDNNFSACPENEDVVCVATGKTLAEVQENIKEAIDFQVVGMLEDGDEVPAEYLEEREYEYHMSARAMLKHSDRFVSRKALAKVTGINEQQLCHYVNGYRHARPEMTRRIASGLNEIAEQLLKIHS